MNGGALAGEGVYWMVSSSVSRLILWFVTLFSPAIVLGAYYSVVNVYAPLWLFAFYGSHTFFIFLGVFNAPESAGIYILATSASLTFPVLLATIMLELIPRGIGRLEYARIMILAYPAFVLCFEVLFLITGDGLFALPVPLAALAQYLRYRQLHQAPSAPVSAVTEAVPIV